MPLRENLPCIGLRRTRASPWSLPGSLIKQRVTEHVGLMAKAAPGITAEAPHCGDSEAKFLSNGLPAAGDGALDCDGHVSVSERLVTDDGHEGREHEDDKADRHRRTNSGKD